MSPRRRAFLRQAGAVGVGAVAAASVPQDAQRAPTDVSPRAGAPDYGYIEPGLYARPGGRFLLRVMARQSAAGRVWGECLNVELVDVPAGWLRPV